MTKCLLIKMPDNRVLFARRTHLPNLIEFCKKFQAKVSFVKADTKNLLDLPELARCLCEPAYTEQYVKYDIIQEDLLNSPITTTASKTDALKKAIYDMFVAGEDVSAKKFEDLLKRQNISVSTFYRYLRKVKLQLIDEEKKNVICNSGKYKIEVQPVPLEVVEGPALTIPAGPA